MKALFILLATILLASCTKSGMYYRYSYTSEKGVTHFVDMQKITLVDSSYVMPKKRSSQERFQNLPGELLAR